MLTYGLDPASSSDYFFQCLYLISDRISEGCPLSESIFNHAKLVLSINILTGMLPSLLIALLCWFVFKKLVNKVEINENT